MGKFQKQPVVVEAITFDQLVEHGRKECGDNLTNGMPWSFDYAGHPITHEDDDCYLIPTLEGTMRFERGDMLITGVNGEIYPCKADIFAKTYRPAPRAGEVDPAIERAVRLGMVAGIKAFAWWKDGRERVGTSGKVLVDAIDALDREGTYENEQFSIAIEEASNEQ